MGMAGIVSRVRGAFTGARQVSLTVLLLLAAAPVSAADSGSATLLHRWSFNGDLKDSAGGRTAMYSGKAALAWNANTNAVSLAGGTRGTSVLQMGAGTVPEGSFTLEFFAALRQDAGNYAPLFQLADATSADALTCSWVSNNRIEMNKGGTLLLREDNKLGAYTLGDLYHVCFTVTTNYDGNGTSRLRFVKRNLTTGADPVVAELVPSAPWSPADLKIRSLNIGFSAWNTNYDPAADYDEIRVWDRVLTDDEIASNAVARAGTLPDYARFPDAAEPSWPSLLHRWSFTENLEDGVGELDGVYSGTAALAYTDGNAIALAGGTRGLSSVSFGPGSIPGGDFTVELFAKNRTIRNWSRILEINDNWSTINNIYFSWTQGTTAAQQRFRVTKASVDVFTREDQLGTIVVGTPYQIFVSCTTNYGGGGQSLIRVGARDLTGASPPRIFEGATTAAWSPTNLISRVLAIGRSSWSTDYDASATYDEVRVWNGALTLDQLAANAANSADHPYSSLLVAGNPVAAGVVEPAYGYTYDIASNTTIQCSATSGAAGASGYSGTCAGYVLYACTNGVETVIAQGTGASFTHNAPGYPCKLVWQWSEINVRLATSSGEGGGVEVSPPSETGFYATNSTVTITATPVAGYAFWKWTGDVPAAQQFDNPLVLNVGETPRAIAAVYSSGLYVTPNGAGTKTGESWGNAFASLQDAIDASATGGTIYLAAGVHTNAQSNAAEYSLCVITNQAWLAIRGGYAGTGAPGLRVGETVLKRPDGRKIRILYGKNVDLRADGVTFENGIREGASGGGIFMDSSTLRLSNCTIRECQVNNTSGGRGAAIYLTKGSLELSDCFIQSNRVVCSSGGWGGYGACVVVESGVTTTVTRCTFDRNWGYGVYRVMTGGALRVNGGIADISSSLFTTNYITLMRNYGDERAYGVGVYAEGTKALRVSDCEFFGNLAHGIHAYGVITLNASGYEGVVERCVIVATNCGTVATAPRPTTAFAANATDFFAGLGVMAGTLVVSNTLIAADTTRPLIKLTGGAAKLTQCTLADGAGYTAYLSGGDLMLSRCIAADCPSGYCQIVGGTFDAEYSCLPSLDGVTRLGNTTNAPLLSTNGYYHAMSRAGYYDGGFFDGGAWRYDATATSPSIDMAPAGDPFALEPQPNGHRANVGYDAATAVASRSDLGEPPHATALAVYAYPPGDVRPATAVARGEVGGPEGAGTSAEVTIVWGAADKGTDSLDAWANQRALGTKTAWDLFPETIANAGSNTYYRFHAVNEDGSAWSDPVVSYRSPRLPTVAGASVTHITRHEATVNWTLADDGERETTASFLYWTDGGAATSTVPYGICAEGAALLRIWGLEAGTTYGWLVEAVNNAGSIRTAPGTFTTFTTAPAARYVTPEGAGLCDGSDWTNAFGNLQEAVDFCRYEGDAIYMKTGEYVQVQPDINDLNHYHITNCPGLTISGRYAGEGTPGERVATRTVIRRHPSRERRLVHAENSTIHLDGVDWADGKYTVTQAFDGFGWWMKNCNLSAADCRFAGNYVGTSGAHSYRGGAFYTEGGSLAFADCEFIGNGFGIWADGSGAYGGAIYASSASSVNFLRCVFDRNTAGSLYHASQGGALRLASCGSVTINECQFLTNSVPKSSTHPTTSAYGGAIYANAVPTLTIANTHFAGNYTVGPAGIGGLLYLSGGKTVMNRCSMVFNGKAGDTTATLGSITLLSGSLYATNVLQAATTRGTGFDIRGGTAELVNVTAANGSQGYGVSVSGGTCAIKNSIIWGNTSGGVSGNVTATYSCLQDEIEGEGNKMEDPLFADATYFHAFSRGGYYTGWFKPTGEWRTDRAPGITKSMSPTIDAGPRGWPFGGEPEPRGRRINLGAYGGTPTASRTCQTGIVILLR